MKFILVLSFSLCGCASNPYYKSVKKVDLMQTEHRLMFEIDWLKEKLKDKIVYVGDYSCKPQKGDK